MQKQKKLLDDSYFSLGRDWHYERFQVAHVMANRWFIAFLCASVLAILLTIALVTLMPLKTLVPLVIHQNSMTGDVWVDRPKTPYVPANDAQVQSDIVRYVTARESYTAADLNPRFHLVMLLSANNIAQQYADFQANDNKKSPVNILGDDGVRTTHIEDIVFIDKAGMQQLRHFRMPSENLAKVDFTTTTTTDSSGNKKIESWVATIGWTYRGLPVDQNDAWDNWNGFTVTTYRVDPRNVNDSGIQE